MHVLLDLSILVADIKFAFVTPLSPLRYVFLEIICLGAFLSGTLGIAQS
jgi:hypothetical protein